jgi:23S rRNA maturation-related 3'-5' exoribonuclease YhaM
MKYEIRYSFWQNQSKHLNYSAAKFLTTSNFERYNAILDIFPLVNTSLTIMGLILKRPMREIYSLLPVYGLVP